jgi:tetratricopeptide (TPR) repeat protein
MKRNEPSEPEIIEMMQSFIQDGITVGSRGLCNDAIEALDKAVLVFQTFKGHSEPVRMLAALALGNKGAALGDLDRHTEAVACYDAAIAIYQKLYRQFRGHVDNATLVADYAVSVMNKGWSLIHLGCEDEGFRCHEEALELRRQLLAGGHEEALPDVARSLYNVGEGYFQAERFNKAVPAFDEAADILHALIAAGQNEHEEDLAYVLAARADTLQMLGRLQEARDTSDEAIDLFVRLARTKRNPKLASALDSALNGRKIILRKLKNS